MSKLEKAIFDLNQAGYMVSIDFQPNGKSACSLLKQEKDSWKYVTGGTGSSPILALEAAKEKLNVEEP